MGLVFDLFIGPSWCPRLSPNLQVKRNDLVGLAAASAASYAYCLLNLEVSGLAVRALGKPVSNNRFLPPNSLQR